MYTTIFDGRRDHYIGDEDSVLSSMNMAARIELHPLLPFDPISDPTSIGQRWKVWKRRFETYLVAIDVKDDKRKRALLL